MLTDVEDTALMEDEIPIPVVDTSSNTKDELTLQHVCCREEVHVVEYNDLQERTGGAPTLEAFLRHRATDPFC